MNNEYLAKARENIKDAKALIVVASRRARQLAYGARPMVRCHEEKNFLDVALLEIAEGKLAAQEGTGDDFLREAQALKEAAKQNGESK